MLSEYPESRRRSNEILYLATGVNAEGVTLDEAAYYILSRESLPNCLPSRTLVDIEVVINVVTFDFCQAFLSTPLLGWRGGAEDAGELGGFLGKKMQ